MDVLKLRGTLKLVVVSGLKRSPFLSGSGYHAKCHLQQHLNVKSDGGVPWCPSNYLIFTVLV